MKFSAKIIPGSQIHRLWKEQHRTGGVLHGVKFIRLGAGDWVSDSDELTAVEVERLKPNPSILIVMRGELVPVPDVATTAPAVTSTVLQGSPVAAAFSPRPVPAPAPSQTTLRMPQPQYQQHGKNRR